MKKAAIGAVLGVLCAAAHADSALAGFMENLYGGLAFGPAHYSHACDGGTVECSNTDSAGYKYWGGWRMSDRIAGEISYINFDRAKATSGTGGNLITRALRTDGFLFNFAFFQPISQDFTGVARVGLARLHTSGTRTTNAGVTEIGRTRGDTSPYLGLAINVDARDMFQRFMPVNLDGFFIEAGVDMTRARFGGEERSMRLWSVGGAFQF